MSRKLDVQTPPPSLSADRADRVFAELERVLSSSLFHSSRRCQSLLRRIIEQSVVSEVNSLKERILGVEVFGRAPDYDTSEDPIVRSAATEVRKKLAQYYQGAGRASELRLHLPPGTYLAEFHFAGDKRAPPGPTPIPLPAAPKRRKLLMSAALVVVAAGLMAIHSRRSNLELLWNPILNTQGDVLVCVGLQAAFNLRAAKAQDSIQGIIRPSADATLYRPMREEDLVLLRNRYVALDDALCLVGITSMLDGYGKRYRVRSERVTSFADLRDAPAVLIGAFDNPWTLRTASQLRFTFRKDSDQDIGMVYDNRHPENARWRISRYWPDWEIPVDYAIVTRMVDAASDRPVFIAAGLTQYGTLGAGEFVTNEKQFSDAARRLPKDWSSKNLQIVLSVPVVNHMAGRPRVLAMHVW
jgi:hypothetical protein